MGDPLAGLGPEELRQRPVQCVFAGERHATRERPVHVNHTETAITDGDQIGNRVECIFQLTARSDDFLEQLHIFQGAG